MSNFIAHLAAHSDFSLSKGVSKVEILVEQAAKLKIPAMAIVDEGNMHGAMKFAEYGAKYGVQPIMGVTLRLVLDKDLEGRIILLAQNEVGFQNICAILDATQQPRPDEGYAGGEGLTTIDILSEHPNDGIIMITGGHDGMLYQMLRKGLYEAAENTVGWFKTLFHDRLYIGVSRFGDETAAEKEIEEQLLEIARSNGPVEFEDGTVLSEIPLVALCDIWYATRDRFGAFELMDAISNGKKVSVTDEGIVPASERRFHIRPAEVVHEIFADLPGAIDNANNIALRCAYMAPSRKPVLPPFETEGGRSEAEELEVQSAAGLVERLEKFSIPADEHPKYQERLAYELGIINKMGFPGYFLIVSDFIKWSKAQGIPVGPGRGSGAGSLVAWVLQITNINPFDYNLLFERFLNPERVSMPDFDIDFCTDRREEVVHYVRDRYGSELVSLIQTFTEIRSKTAIHDIGRVMVSDKFGGFTPFDTHRMAKLVSMDGPNPKSVQESLDDPTNPEFKAFVESDPKFGVLARNAAELEGTKRQTSTHAAGVIISGGALHRMGPVGYDPKSGMRVCQYDMKKAEETGWVKFDFLGLKTLSVIKETLKNIKESTGEEIDIDLIPLDDAPTYAMLAEGHSNGVFQVESEGMKKALKQIKPTRIDDLIAVGALYRPGPMEMIPLYADRKNGVKVPEYPEPVAGTKPFLEETFGILVYQEQVMQVAQVVAGYSLGGADLLRRAMGKKIKEEMDKQRILFVEGAVKNGHSEKDAGALFDTIAKFANYGFNKSHAAAYGVISYQTAYLKKNYPAQFYAASLTYSDKPEKMALIKEDMDSDGVPMLLPDINKSGPRFQSEQLPDGSFGVRFGLNAIKGVNGDMNALFEARQNGPFNSLVDFHQRMAGEFRGNQLEKLTEAGAFDGLNTNRAATTSILKWLAKGNKKETTQIDMFGSSEPVQIPAKVSEIVEWGNKADREFNAVGFYFGAHPLDVYQPKFEKLKVKRKQSLIEYMKANKLADLPMVRMAGLVEEFERKRTKNGAPYLRARFQERKTVFYASFFSRRDLPPDHIEQLEAILNNAKLGRRPVVIEAQVRLDEGFEGVSIFGRKILDAEELVSQERGKMMITLDRDFVKSTVEEQRKLSQLRIDVETGKVTAENAAKIETGIRQEAVIRKAKEFLDFATTIREDDNPKAVPIVMKLIQGDHTNIRAMQGRYVISLAAETTLKSMDGIVSVQETITE